MFTRPVLSAACVALLAAPAFGQFLTPAQYTVGNIGATTIVRPPAFALGYGAFNPNYSMPAFVPGVGYGYYPNFTGLRPSYWSLPGRYNAYPWSGAGVYTGGTGVYAYYAPFFYGSGIDVGLSVPYSTYTSYGPSMSGEPGNAYAGVLYQAPVAVATYSRSAQSTLIVPPAAPSDRAVLSVQVPADATVWVQGAATKQTGTTREFISPPLDPGRDYTYTVKAQWKSGDQNVEQTQTVTVRAGDRSGLLFLSGATAKLPAGR